jgi:hypothetical protein
MTGPDAFDMEEACQIISAATGKKISFINISFEEYKQGLISKGVSEHGIRVLMEVNKERSKCLDSHIRLNTHRLFGIRPTNFAEFIYKNKEVFSS